MFGCFINSCPTHLRSSALPNMNSCFRVCLLHCLGLQIIGSPKQTKPLLRHSFHPQLSGWDHSTEDVCFELKLELFNPDVLSLSWLDHLKLCHLMQGVRAWPVCSCLSSPFKKIRQKLQLKQTQKCDVANLKILGT